MTLADTINGAFELGGAFALLLSVRRLHREKMVRGVSTLAIFFFASWGGWNLAFYSGLSQWTSFYGSILLTGVNVVYLGQIFYYTRSARCAS
jgi:uncharacterized membrane protein YfcA